MPLIETREKGKITLVRWGLEDHGIETFTFCVRWDKGGEQGFGGLALNDELKAELQEEMRKVFGTHEPVGFEIETIKYSVDGHDFGQHIEGLIYKGVRWEINEWRRKRFPELKIKSLLEKEIDDEERELAYCQRRTEEVRAKIAKLKALR
jgi:hypothetical protein